MKKVCLILINLMILLSMFCTGSFASNQIKLFKTQDSINNTVENNNGALMLRQNWYGMKFEINPVKQYGLRKLNAVDIDEYAKALKEVNFGINQNSVKESVYNEIYSPVSVNIYFLDCRLKDYSNAMALSFKDNSIVVFGSYYTLSKQTIHRLAVHEMGHQIDFQLMNSEKWNEYKKLRGIEDTYKYKDSSKVYNERPQEIFAEDFRLLFGGEASREATHLNSNLQDPTKITGLKEFFLSLVSQSK